MALIFQHRVDVSQPGFAVAVHPDGNHVAVPHPSPSGAGVSVWEWGPSGWGAEVVDDTSAAGTNAFDVAWSPDGAYLALAHSGSPFVTVYAWDGSSLTAVSNPATLPPAQANTVAFSPGGGQLVAGGPAPWLAAWTWSAGWGAFLNNAPSLPGTPQQVAFSPSGAHLACAHGTTPVISAWAFTGAGFGAKVANPATVPSALGGGGTSVAFTEAGDFLAVGHSASPYVSVYPWTGAFGAKVADPSQLPGSGDAVGFSPGDTHIVTAANVTVDGEVRRILAWEWSGGFGALMPHPDGQPGIATRDIAFAPAGNVIAVSDNSPSLVGYLIRSTFYVGRLALA